VVLFDVGGVLVELGGAATLLSWLGNRITLPELGLDVDAGLFLESFACWPSAVYPGALDMIARIPSHYRRALLSNSNVLHWRRVLDELGLGALFEHQFASHLMGKIKPDAEAFEHVLASLDCQAAQVLFLDDNILNVEAARRIGMRADLVRGAHEARRSLQQAGVITAC
jgi:HAD superfamily hydrolase (TIGR01509 family)